MLAVMWLSTVKLDSYIMVDSCYKFMCLLAVIWLVAVMWLVEFCHMAGSCHVPGSCHVLGLAVMNW